MQGEGEVAVRGDAGLRVFILALDSAAQGKWLPAHNGKANSLHQFDFQTTHLCSYYPHFIPRKLVLEIKVPVSQIWGEAEKNLNPDLPNSKACAFLWCVQGLGRNSREDHGEL